MSNSFWARIGGGGPWRIRRRLRDGACGPARLLSLPASDVQNLTVGPRIPLNANDALDDPGRPRTAREWAAGAALRLCEDASKARREAEAAGASATIAGETTASLPKTCSDEALQGLRRFDEQERRVIAAVNE